MLILALEQSGTQEGEWILSQLISDNELEETHRLRSTISIARMGDVNTLVAFRSLQDAMKEKGSLLANTALINMGVLGKRAPSLSNQVDEFLVEKLQSDSETYRTLIAINNSTTANLSEQISPFLNSASSSERELAVSILSRDSSSAPLLNEALKKETNPSVMQKLLSVQGKDGYINQELMIDLQQRAVDKATPMVTREIIFGFLLNHASSSFEIREVARDIQKQRSVSDAMEKKISDLLAH
ncbi:hypothetical protein [Veronia nyctiphanis]|uniref:hypothetical protein n=1 Tax=Veronia nyctiphanis TaxID=1278244 RepID=UPI00100ABBCA|nr:hypothetical protein [Veronia nyctiphanis]